MCLTFPFPRIRETIRAGFYDPRHAFAEAIADIIQPPLTPLILGAIVQKRRNGEDFIASVL
jgi:hypothetical protein